MMYDQLYRIPQGKDAAMAPDYTVTLIEKRAGVGQGNTAARGPWLRTLAVIRSLPTIKPCKP